MPFLRTVSLLLPCVKGKLVTPERKSPSFQSTESAALPILQNFTLNRSRTEVIYYDRTTTWAVVKQETETQKRNTETQKRNAETQKRNTETGFHKSWNLGLGMAAGRHGGMAAWRHGGMTKLLLLSLKYNKLL